MVKSSKIYKVFGKALHSHKKVHILKGLPKIFLFSISIYSILIFQLFGFLEVNSWVY